ncbi:hypothetical protein AB0L80_31815 [Streptomyces sp. NPDC052069]|uniref:hypothetical protein n=1 Tax=Streptomyces sp. NPDC052069 TaxID=3154650 RepID=UPI0034258D0B
MRIRMKVQMSGLRNGQPWPAFGEVTELPTGEAQHLVASGIAEEVTILAEVETATASTPETTEPPKAEVSEIPAETKRSRGRPRKPPVEE